GQNVFLTGTCKEFKLEIGQNGVPHNATEAVSLSLAVQGGNLLHTEATCNGGGSGAAGAVLSIAAGASVSQSFWVRQPSAATNMFMASSSTPAYTNTHLNNSSLAFYSPSPSYNAVKIMSDAAMAVGVCYPVQVTLLSGAGFGGSSGSVGIDLSTNILAGTFHLAANCGDGPLATGGSPDVTIPAYTHSANLYFSPTSATSGGAMTATTVGTAFTNALSANAGLNTHTGYKVKVEGPAREFDLANTCLPVRIEAVNSVGARVTSPIARTLTATVASGGILYSTPNCTGGTNIPSKSFSMAAAGNTSNEIVYAELDNSSNHFEFNIVDSSLVGSPFNGTGLQIFAKQLSNFRIVRDDLLPMNSVMTKLCYKAKVQSLNDGFGTTPVNADTQVDLSVPGGSGIVYATDSACVGTSNLGSVTIPRGASVSNGFYIMTTSYGANACDAILSRTSGHSPSSGTYPCAAVNTHQLYVEKVSVADLKVTLHDSFSAATVANLPIQFNVSLSGGCTIGGQSNFTAQISQGNSFYTNTVSGTSCTATVTHIPNALFTPHSIFWITGSPTF
ncbi:MAG: hypothetical protein V4692_03715, partial [Bdellovibrionota bacterium]